MKILRKGFTLVELIVVITILAILGTIAFISLQGYAKDARDSVRVQDFANIKKSLELFVTEKGFYPIPSGATDMTYSGGVVWQQGTFGDSVVENLGQLNKKPVDPLLETEYSYSLTNAKTEYELGGVVEGGGAFSSLPFTNQASAATNYMALVGGSYNGKVLQVSTGGLDYLLALPSITTTDIATTDVITTTTNKGLVYNGEANLPSNYSSIEGFTTTGGFEYDPSSLVVFEGTKADLGYTAGKVEFIENLQNAYSGTLLSFKAEFNDLLSFDAITNRDTAKNFALNIFETVPQFSGDLKTSSFEPTDVSNLKLWLDADDLYTITKDGSNLVSQWNDKSGNDNHATQGTSSNQFLFTPNQLNGRTVLSADGSDYVLLPSGLYSVFNGDSTVLAVVIKDTAAVSSKRLFTAAVGGSSKVNLYSAVSDFGYYHNQTFASIVAPANIVNWNIVTSGKRGVNQFVSVNSGVEVVDTTGLDVSGIDQLSIFAHPGGSAGWDGDIAEFLMYDKALNATEITQIETYLKDKWGL